MKRAARRAAIYHPGQKTAEPVRAGPCGRVTARGTQEEESPRGPGQQLERHAESRVRGQENRKGGERKTGRRGKKAPREKPG